MMMEYVETHAGNTYVRGSRVPVHRLWNWHRKGVSIETLIKRYPTLGPASVLGALAFAYEHQSNMNEEIDAANAMLDDARHPGAPLPSEGENGNGA